jgi:hypothetical protein
LAWLLLACFAAAAGFEPVLLAVPAAFLAAILAVDFWTARGGAPGGAAALGLAIVGPALALAGHVLGAWSLVPLALCVTLVALNRGFYAFLARERHPLFALLAIPLHLLYYACSGVALALGSLRYAWRTFRSG